MISPWKERWSLGEGAGVSDDYHFIENLTKKGFELHFIVPKGGEQKELGFENLFFHTYPNFFDAMSGWPTALKRIIWPLAFWTLVSVRALVVGRRLQPHFVLGHSHYATVPAYMCRELLRVPSGVKLFGVMDLVHTEWSRLKYYYKNLEHILAMKVPQDVWIILDDGTSGREAAIRHGVPSDKIRFLPNGINIEWAAQTYERTRVREELSIPKQAKVVLFLARLVTSKRPQLLI
ncbi:MAG: glycosyltransferase, partial [Candidatus Krumholzibacteria bacterium]|nr:glycosyltransferase [Candidatus Krumholzibacteria bacterium]